jgi:putative FmdB family regulatory protein
MPIYEYVCSSCGHRTDILHGVHDPGPHFCPECGTEGSMRKAFAPPAIVFKGSGWAKKERRSSSESGSAASSAKNDGVRGSSKADAGSTAGGAAKTDGGRGGSDGGSGGSDGPAGSGSTSPRGDSD